MKVNVFIDALLVKPLLILFAGTYVNEMIHHQRYTTRSNAESAIQEYIEIFYNRQRRHSRLGYVSPAQFAENFSKQARAA